MKKSLLQKARAQYQPKLPKGLKGAVSVKEGAPTQSVGDQEEIKKLFPNTYGMLYINDQMALSTRMYDLPEHQWGIFSAGSEVTLTGLQTSTL